MFVPTVTHYGERLRLVPDKRWLAWQADVSLEIDMTEPQAKRHHWWPECVSKHWADTAGGVHWILPDGEVRRAKPASFGVIGNGHFIKLDDGELARHATENLVKGGLTRNALEADPTFAAGFSAARERVANMQFRWVDEADPNRQCLLEIYAAVVRNARYNDFINH
ncbi:hypothetical protein EQZ23_19465 [Sphingomonas sp. UV9]|uniref:hypothetical protein n=1 Tax=Sphingomonas sp. UV9 TaxID=1851410 RepID=UPI000FFC402E|nr:hypothetical protein [Sphingomonas sp. UV9]RXD01706.1 hypothetical protein EQZ23_19465 [Sphingomonas sp. UV9]